jgi:glycosyl-4,4'-diaponeurosporenoate acyltransferase
MRVFYFPVPVTVAVDIAVWLAVQFAAAKFVTGLPAERLGADGWLYRARPWERGGAFYEFLGVKRWKDRLPDAGPWFAGGFAKRDLSSRGRDYLRRFLVETCRGELAHWLAMSAAPFFFSVEPALGGGIDGGLRPGGQPALRHRPALQPRAAGAALGKKITLTARSPRRDRGATPTTV